MAAISDAKREEIARALGGKGVQPGCPQCGSGTRSVAPYLTAAPMLTVAAPVLTMGERRAMFAVYRCDACGATMLFDLDTLGVQP